MGDALATYFEARACQRSNAGNCVGGKITLAAMALAKLCYETLLESGVGAYLAVQAKACTKAVEHVIEANTYLSGIGFESGGLAGAHAIHNGLTAKMCIRDSAGSAQRSQRQSGSGSTENMGGRTRPYRLL